MCCVEVLRKTVVWTEARQAGLNSESGRERASFEPTLTVGLLYGSALDDQVSQLMLGNHSDVTYIVSAARPPLLRWEDRINVEG
jgi:hypothetical protein